LIILSLKIYHTEIRKEESKRKHEERDKIINAQSYNKKIFYQMIRKQRNNKNIIVEDLYVGNTLYEGDNIFKGWHEHSHIRQWNSLDPSLRNVDSIAKFKPELRKRKDISQVPKHYEIGPRKLHIILTKLRCFASFLNYDLFQ
jgi:hypothetical protein